LQEIKKIYKETDNKQFQTVFPKVSSFVGNPNYTTLCCNIELLKYFDIMNIMIDILNIVLDILNIMFDILNIMFDIMNIMFDIMNIMFDIMNIMFDIMNIMFDNKNIMFNIMNIMLATVISHIKNLSVTSILRRCFSLFLSEIVR